VNKPSILNTWHSECDPSADVFKDIYVNDEHGSIRSPQNDQSSFTELFNETTGLLRSVFLIENIKHKEKRYGSKFSQDSPIAIVRTAFDAIFHDVSATVRSYFN